MREAKAMHAAIRAGQRRRHLDDERVAFHRKLQQRMCTVTRVRIKRRGDTRRLNDHSTRRQVLGRFQDVRPSGNRQRNRLSIYQLPTNIVVRDLREQNRRIALDQDIDGEIHRMSWRGCHDDLIGRGIDTPCGQPFRAQFFDEQRVIVLTLDAPARDGLLGESETQ